MQLTLLPTRLGTTSSDQHYNNEGLLLRSYAHHRMKKPSSFYLGHDHPHFFHHIIHQFPHSFDSRFFHSQSIEKAINSTQTTFLHCKEIVSSAVFLLRSALRIGWRRSQISDIASSQTLKSLSGTPIPLVLLSYRASHSTIYFPYQAECNQRPSAQKPIALHLFEQWHLARSP